MTIQEILKEIGLTDEQIGSVAESMKKNRVFTSSEENLDIRYDKLKGDHENLKKQNMEAQSLIEELKKSSKGNESLMAKVSDYEAKIAELSEQLKEEKLASAIKVGLLSEKATDIDYLTFKLKESGDLEMDEKDQIKGWEEKVSELKKKFPGQFETSAQKKIDPNNLQKGNPETHLTKESILRMPYQQRVELYQQDPEGFNSIMKS